MVQDVVVQDVVAEVKEDVGTQISPPPITFLAWEDQHDVSTAGLAATAAITSVHAASPKRRDIRTKQLLRPK